MPEYLTPGVYCEFYDAGPPVIRRVRTDIPGFVGLAERGTLKQAVQLNSWRQFQAEYGNFVSYGFLAYAVKGFFENGGKTCFVARAAGQTATKSKLMLQNASGTDVIRFRAKNEGVWGDQVAVTFTRLSTNDLVFSLMVTRGLDRETFPDLSIKPVDERYFVRVIEEGDERRASSKWITAEDLLSPDLTRSASHLPDLTALALQQRPGFLNGGQDGISSLVKTDFTDALAVFETVDAVAMLAVPDIHIQPVIQPPPPPPRPKPPKDPCDLNSAAVPPPVAPVSAGPSEEPPSFRDEEIFFVQQTMVEQCEHYKDRIAILEVPIRPGGKVRTLPEVRRWRNRFDSPRGFAALYHPWIKVVDPLHLNNKPVRSIPPCGHVAGAYALADETVGVHKAPANMRLEWAEDVTVEIGDEVQGVLNPEGVNCIRPFPGRGIRVYGARTVSPDPDWRFVNVRRLLMMIEEAVDESTQWSVFEPNDFNLRQKLVLSVSAFLDSIWREGGLKGAVREEAFFVKCDETNNPSFVTDAGKVIVDIGVAPTIPAEFVVFRIGRTVDEFEIVER